MKTIVRKIEHNEEDEQIIKMAGAVLKQGGLVAFPTETVYGLGADALNRDAALKTYEAKGRPSDNPLIVHIAEVKDLKEIAVNIPKTAYDLAARFWPGPLTMILEKSDIVPLEITGGLDTVAVRIPDNEIVRRLILAAGGFVSAPSANQSGRPSPTTAEHVKEDLDGRVSMIIDGGSVQIGLESTIVDMTASPPVILRPGAITYEMLEEVLGNVEIGEASVDEENEDAPRAPGMKYRHYAPKGQLIIVEGDQQETVKAIKQIAYEQTRLGYKVGIIATSEVQGLYTVGCVKNIGSRENENVIAKNIYRILREFDEEGVEYIYSESFEEGGIGHAIMNRLNKAAGYHTLQASEITKLQRYRRILFISSSDNSRGPMAAAILKNTPLLQEYTIDSRGLVVLFPEPANQKAEAIVKSHQMTLAEHEATAFSEQDLDEETLILTMEEAQKWKIVSEYEFVKNVYTLNEFVDEDGEVTSPYGQALPVYGETFETLKRLVQKLAEQLNEEAKQ